MNVLTSCVRAQLDGPDKETEEGRRATWLDTRDLEDDFKELVYLTIQEVGSLSNTTVLSELCLSCNFNEIYFFLNIKKTKFVHFHSIVSWAKITLCCAGFKPSGLKTSP